MSSRLVAMRAAVRGWSPVIMIVRVPARCASASATAGAASGRAGSIMPTLAAYTKSRSMLELASGSLVLGGSACGQVR